MTMNAPLNGIRVMSIGHTLPGMYCIAILRDLGTDVVRIERVPGSRGATRYQGVAGSFPTRSLLHSTSTCELNLKHPQGPPVFRRMAQQADIVLEGFRPGVADRLGIGYETLREKNPRLIYAAISGYGQEGPWRDRVGHDINYLASSGMLALGWGPRGSPGVPGATVADGLAGINAALNILAALQTRQATGQGAFLDIAITDGPLFLMASEIEYYHTSGRSRLAGDTHLTGRHPWYHLFETADGGYLSVGAIEPPFYARLCELVGRPDLATLQFVEGTDLQEQLRLFAELFKTKTRDQWTALLAGEETCVAPVLSPGEAAEAPQNQRAFVASHEAGAPRWARSPVRLPLAPPAQERKTAESLASYGFSHEQIAQLQEQKIIGA